LVPSSATAASFRTPIARAHRRKHRETSVAADRAPVGHKEKVWGRKEAISNLPILSQGNSCKSDSLLARRSARSGPVHGDQPGELAE
jgi:hypothetical protein